MNEYAFRFNNVSKRRHGYLSKVSFALPTGTIMALVGPNGAGKTTAIRALTGIAGFDEGEITLFDHDVRADIPKDKDNLSVVLDEIPYGDSFTAEQVEYILAGVYSSWDTEQFHAYLRRFHLIPSKRIREYSIGMKQKLQLACALSHDAKLLVLDEPLSDLDPASKEEVMDCIMQYMQPGDRSALITTNTPADIDKYVDWVTILLSGSVAISDERDRLLESYGILRCSKEEAETLTSPDIVLVRSNQYGAAALVKNRDKVAAEYAGMTVDPATIDDILIFYSIKGMGVVR